MFRHFRLGTCFSVAKGDQDNGYCISSSWMRPDLFGSIHAEQTFFKMAKCSFWFPNWFNSNQVKVRRKARAQASCYFHNITKSVITLVALRGIELAIRRILLILDLPLF
jgi:hypothetical protein